MDTHIFRDLGLLIGLLTLILSGLILFDIYSNLHVLVGMIENKVIPLLEEIAKNRFEEN